MKKRFLSAVLLFVCASAFAQQTEIVWSEDFERWSAGAPETWLDPSARFRTTADPANAANVVYGARHPAPKQRAAGRRTPGDLPDLGATSTLADRSFLAHDGFELRGRFRRDTAESLLGITFFSGQPERDDYRLIALWRRSGEAAPVMRLYRFGAADAELHASAFTPLPGVWYRFAIRADREFNATRYRARFWRDGEAEPQTWQLEAADPGPSPTGRIGLWSSVGGALFDDLSVSAVVEEIADQIPPSIVFSESQEVIPGGTTEAFNRDARVDVRAFDGSGIQSLTVTLDGAPYTPLAPIATERKHTLRARAVDKKGNAAEAEIAVVVDKTPPVIEVRESGALMANGLLVNRGVVPTFTVADLTATTDVATIDDATFVSGSSVEDERAHRLVIRATDAVGWTSSVTLDFTIDRTPPVIAFSEGSGTAIRNKDTAVGVTATDANGVATLAATLAGATYVPGTPITAEGPHALAATATDHAGNTAQAQLALVIDKTPPVISVTDAGAPLLTGLLTNADVTPAIAITDLTDTTVDAKLNGAPFVSATTVDDERLHTLVVTATDAAGWTSDVTRTFTIDRTPPVITITSPSADQSLNASTVDVTGSSDDATRVIVNNVEATIDAAAKTYTRRAVPLLEGANPIVATGTDAAGNSGRAELRVHVDHRAPELVVTAPAANVCLGASEVVMRGTARDATTIRVRANDGPWIGATLTGTDWSATVPLPAEGIVALVVEAGDGGGRTATASLPVRVDRTKPVIAVSENGAPLTGTLFNRVIAPLVRVSDGDAGARVTVTLDGAPFVAGTVLRDDATYVLRATAADCAGNTADAVELTFTIDRTPPRIESIDPADGTTVGARSPLSGTLSEPATLVDEGSGTNATVNGVAFTLPTTTFAEGLNERVFVATDPAGNVSRTPYSLRVKSDAPFVEIVEDGAPIPADALFNRVVKPVIRVSDASATITATLNGEPFTSGGAVSADASYTLIATATDAFGHVSDRATATFTIDRTPPRIDITTPADGAAVGTESVEVRGTVDADATGVTINGVAATLTGTSFTANVLLEQGTNLLNGSARDRAGNVGRDRVEVTRAGGPLAIILTSPPDDMLTNRPTTVVAGQVLTMPPSGTVQVNGVDIPVTAGGTFRKVDFPLAEGENDIVASVAGARGEVNSVAVEVLADFTPPVLRVTANAIDLANGARFAVSPVLAIEATDNVPHGLVNELTIDGAVITGAIPALAIGGHSLSAIARDAAGNETRVDRTFFIGDSVSVAGCGLTAIDPVDGAAVFVDLLRITGRSGGAAGVLINGKSAQVADGSFCGEATLVPGRNEIVIRCADSSGNATDDPPVTLIVHRDVEPSITITSPASGTTLTTATLTVSGTVSEGVVSGDVNGLPFTVTGTTFSVPNVTLTTGLNTIIARARSGAGRTAIATARATLLAATPQLAITSPIAGTETGVASLDVTGTYVHVDPSTITVNGAAATTIALSDTSGTFSGIASLAPGQENVVTAAGRNHAGPEARATVDVTHVVNAPSIAITAPTDNSYFAADATTAPVSGTFTAPPGSQVIVNGVLATTDGAGFSASVPLGTSTTTPIVARVSTPAGEDALDSVRAIRFAAPLALRDSFPTHDATGVDRGVAVILLFNNVLDASTVAVNVADGSNAPVAGQLYVDRDAVTFAPHQPLRASETYTVTIPATVRDAADAALAAPVVRRFTTGGTAPAAPPVVDDLETTGCFTTVTMTGRAATPGARVRLDADGVTLTTVASDTGAFKFTFSFSGQSGYHIARVRELGADGSLSAERALCFRVNCELPRVVAATLDRAAKQLHVDFSRPMDATTLILGTTLLVDPPLAGTVTTSAQTTTITFTEDVPPAKLTLTVKQSVRDEDGATLAADYTQSFDYETSTTERGKGYVTGAIYDATTGRPLPNATIEILNPQSSILNSNDRGRYSQPLPEGAYTLRATAPGFAPVYRQLLVPAGAGVVPIDIRLTHRGTALTHGGDTTLTKRVDLDLANASLPPGTEVRVSSIGAQSLAGLLPLGWSPIAATEISGTDAPLTGAKLTIHTGATTRTLTLAKYDETRDEWRVVHAATTPTDGRVTLDVTASGHYALVYPDAAPHLAHPAPPQAGAALQGVISPCVAEPAKCTLTGRSFTLEPRAILPNGRAVATLVTDGATQLYPSGTAVQATIDEQLNLADGRVIVDPPFATDLLLYRTLAGDAAVADFHLAPTAQAAAVTLRDGVERIRFVEYPGRIDRGTLLGSEGGRIPADGRITIDVPSGATTEPLHASAASLPDADLAAFGPIAGFRIAGGFALTLTRASASAPVDGVVDVAPSLVIPARASFTVSSSILNPQSSIPHVIVVEVLPATPYGILYRLVALAEPVSDVTGGKLYATRAVDSLQLPIDGIVRDGRYLVLVADAPIAYAYGLVRTGLEGVAIADARVTANNLGVTSLTARSGLFVLPVAAKPAAPFTLVARTPATGDGATAAAPAAPDAGAFVNFGVLPLVAQPPKLQSVAPNGGELAVTAAFVVRAEFDAPIDPDSVADGIRVTNVTTNEDLPGAVAAAGNSVTFNAGEPLRAASQYAITIAPTIRGTNGAPFGQTVVKNFRTASRPADNTIRPERIRITIPDANGRSTIRGEAGALPAGAQAVAVRRDRDFVVRYQATAAADGTFSFDAGHDDPADGIAVTDLIDLQVIDPVSRGIVAVIPLTPFAGADLRSFIAPPGRDTTFVTADGIRVRVPAGAFDVATHITVTPAAKAAFADVPKFDHDLNFATAVELQFDGVAKQRIDVDLPVPAGVTTDNRRWLVGSLGQSIRGPRVMIVDLAYASGGRFLTGLAPTGSGAMQYTALKAGANAGVTGPELREYLLGINRSGIYALVDFTLTGGPVAFGILTGLQAGYDLFWDTLESLYAAHFYLLEGRGRIAIPVVTGKQFQLAGVDAATGLEGFAKVYDPIPNGDPGTTVPLPNPSPDRIGPYPILGSPFRVEPLDVTVKDVDIEAVRDFTVRLSNGIITATSTLDPALEVALLNVSNGQLDPSRTGNLSVEGTLGDRVVLLAGQRDVDPYAPFSIVFSEPVAADDPSEFFEITLDGEPIQLDARLDSGGRRVLFDFPASLQRGAKYRLEISNELADASGLRIGQTRDANGVDGPPLPEPLYLEFEVRKPADKVASFDLGQGRIRDQALNGNVLFVSALDGGIFAHDVSNPAGLTADSAPLGHHPAGVTEYWGLASDHHGRVYATGMTSLMGVVRSFRLEDFVKGEMNVTHKGASSVSFVPGAAAAMNIASRVIASDRPEAIPRKIQVLVQDAEVGYDDRAEFKTLGGATMTNTIGDLEELKLESPYDPDKKYALQRVTVENLTLDMRWSADATPAAPAKIEGIVGRATDRFRVLHNEMTYGVVSLLGYGIAVLDLNAMDSNDAPEKPANYTTMRELVRLTSGKVYEQCGALAPTAIPDLTFTPDAAIRTVPGSTDIQVFAMDPHRGVLDLRVQPPVLEEEGELPPDRVRCDERMSGTGLVFRTLKNEPDATPYHDHPRLAKLRELYQNATGRAPFGRFNAAAPYSWTLEAQDNRTVTPATTPGTIALGQRGSMAGERVRRDYILVPGHQYGLLVVEIGGDPPAATHAGAPPLTNGHLVDVIWIPHGASAVRTVPRTHLAAVTDHEGHVLLVDLARIDERWNEDGAIPDDELFPTVRGILENGAERPDPRIVWRSEKPLASGTLAPIVQADTGFVFAGMLLATTMNVVAAIDPRIEIKADTGAAAGLSAIGGVVPLGIEPPPAVPLKGPNASLGAFRFEVALPGALDESLAGAKFLLDVDSERVFGAKTADTPAAWPRAHLKLPMQRTVPSSLTALRHQRGFNKWISPWVVAIADPRASEKYTWPANADRAKEGCFACTRPEHLKGKKESDGVYELYTNGRLLKVQPNADFAGSPYAYLSTGGRLTTRFPTVMADSVRAPQVLVAANAPAVAGGMLQETTYLHSGELETGAVDLDAGGRAGWNVLVDRTWRSRTIGGSPLGAGWDSSIFRRLRALPTGHVEYRDGGGEVWRFTSNGSGGYTAPPGLFLGLTRNDRGWLLVDQQGRITAFDELGRISVETDEFAPHPYAVDQGNVIRYLYGRDGLVRKIVDPVGREVKLDYQDDRLRTVTDKRGRVVTYGHDPQGRLSSVKLPQVANADGVAPELVYGFDSAGGAFNDTLETATNVNSISDLKQTPRVTFVYGSGADRDKVTQQKWATGETATFAYTTSAATVHDALKQERRYTLTAQPDDYHADRAHVLQVDELAVETSTFAFGALPSAVTNVPPRAPRTRTFSFTYDKGLLQTATLAGVSKTTNHYQQAGSAPGFILASTETEPLGGSAGTITRTFGYKKNNVSSVVAEAGGATSSLQFAVPHLGKLTDTAPNDSVTETVRVDAYGRLSSATSAGGTDAGTQGSAAELTYDPPGTPWHALGALTKVNRAGLETKIAYPTPNQVETTDVERSVKATTELDEWLRPKNVTTTGPGLELKSEVAYDGNGRVRTNKRLQDGEWITETFHYDAVGRLERTENDGAATPSGKFETEVDYDLANRRIMRTLPGGAEVIETLDGLGRVMTRTTVTGSSDIVENFAYDLAGNLVYSGDNHLASATAYDAHGRATAALHADGTRTEWSEHDPLGNAELVQSLDADGALAGETRPKFTAAGRLESIASKVDATQTRETLLRWDGAGRSTFADTAGRTSSQRFDEAGRLLSAATPFSTLTATSHIGTLVKGAQLEEKGSSAPVVTSQEYDTLANVTRQTVGSLTWQQTYDQDGNLTSALRPDRGESSRHNYDYDAVGNLTAERKPGATFEHGYDDAGAPASYKDPTDPPTSTVNDRIGRPRVRTYADLTTETFEWDGPRLQSTKDREGRVFVYDYNAKGQVWQIRGAGGSIVEQLDYHPSGQLAKWRTRDAELSYENYDLEGRPRLTRQKRYANHSGFGARTPLDELTQEHEWNVHGERKAWTMPSGGITGGTLPPQWTTRVEEHHDAEGNVELIERTLSGASSSALLGASYRNAGRPAQRTITTESAATIARDYQYDPGTGQLDDFQVTAGGRVVAGSHIEYEGVQVKKATLHGLSGARANEYTYDDRGRLATSKAARQESAPPSTEVLTPADFRMQLDRPPGALPSLTFGEQTGHKIASLTRGAETRTFSYGAGAERISDGRFRYEFDARGRLIKATEEVPAGATSSLTLRRVHYDYSASGRIVGRRAEYAQLGSSSTTLQESDWKLENRASILAADALPADTTFVFDPISDQLVAIHDATTGAPLRQIIHGGNGYDDPIEVAVADGPSTVGRLYPIFDEAGAGTLQAILNANGEVISRTVAEGAYGEDEFSLAGPAVDRIELAATKNGAGAIDTVTVTIRVTEALAPDTVATGARLAVVDESGAVVRSAATTPSLVANDDATLRWTLTGAEWTALVSEVSSAPQSLSIAVTNTLRAAAWSPDTPILPPPAAQPNLHTSTPLPVEYREPLTPLATWLTSLPPATTQTTPLLTTPSLSALGGSSTPAARMLVSAGFQALPFSEPATGLTYARARWYDSGTGTFLSPDPARYEDSSNLYSFAAGDPVNYRDPTGLRVGDWWDARSYKDAVKPTLKGWWNFASLGTLERVEKQNNLGTWKGVAQATGQGITRISNAASFGLQDSIYQTQMSEGAGLKSIAKGVGRAGVNLTPYEEIKTLVVNPNLSTEQQLQLGLVAVAKTAGLAALGKGLYDGIPGPVQVKNPYSVQTLSENAFLSDVEVAYAATQAAAAPTRFIRSQYAAEAPAALRNDVLDKVPQCPYCGVRPSTQLEHVDAFKLDFVRGGWKDSFTSRTNRLNAPDNVTGACNRCNPSKGARELGSEPGQWWPAAWPQGVWWPFGGKPGS